MVRFMGKVVKVWFALNGGVFCIGPASADDVGCTVLLCLSNPAGWASVNECVAPVQNMFANLRSGGSLSCDMGGGTMPRLAYSQGQKPSQRWITWLNSAAVRQTTYY